MTEINSGRSSFDSDTAVYRNRSSTYSINERQKKSSKIEDNENGLDNVKDMEDFLKGLTSESDFMAESMPTTTSEIDNVKTKKNKNKKRTSSLIGTNVIDEIRKDIDNTRLGDFPSKEEIDDDIRTPPRVARRKKNPISRATSKQSSLLIANEWNANEILEGIYIGDADSSRNKEKLKQNKITHIMTLVGDFEPAYPKEFEYLTIDALDSGDYDMISNFPFTNEFIDNAISSKGRILVHCHKGVSRSATAVLAYIMSHRGYNFDDAVDLVSSKRPIACPNLGFIKQLKLYEKMKYNLEQLHTPDHEEYKKLKLKSLLLSLKFKWEVEKSSIRYPYLGDTLAKQDEFVSKEVYLCKVCKAILFNAGTIIEHQPPDSNTSEKSICNSIFCIPFNWMGEGLTEESGKIKCQHCQALLGKWNWKEGLDCTCSVRMKPAFQLLDAVIVKEQVSNLAEIVKETSKSPSRKSLPWRFSASALKHMERTKTVSSPKSEKEEKPSPISPKERFLSIRRPKAQSPELAKRMTYSTGTLRNYRGSLEIKDEDMTDIEPRKSMVIEETQPENESKVEVETKKESSIMSPKKLFQSIVKRKGKAHTVDSLPKAELPGSSSPRKLSMFLKLSSKNTEKKKSDV